MMLGRTHSLVGINLELTNVCPYRCPQCYVPFGGEDRFLPREKAFYWIAEADRNGIRYVNMSGGETLCYPHLEELISECSRRGMKASVSLSGAFASQERLHALYAAGISSICISLKGRQIDNKLVRIRRFYIFNSIFMLKNSSGFIKVIAKILSKSGYIF